MSSNTTPSNITPSDITPSDITLCDCHDMPADIFFNPDRDTAPGLDLDHARACDDADALADHPDGHPRSASRRAGQPEFHTRRKVT